MKALRAIQVLTMLLIAAARLSAQIAPEGVADAAHRGGSYDPQKLDSVRQAHPVSGQVSVKIPFTTTPQGGRGSKIPFALLYNSASIPAAWMPSR